MLQRSKMCVCERERERERERENHNNFTNGLKYHMAKDLCIEANGFTSRKGPAVESFDKNLVRHFNSFQ